jgi:hypothetical protein
MGKAVTAVQDDLELISLAVSIGSLIPEFVLVRLGVDAIATIYGYVSEGTLSDYEDALTNAPLLSDLICAIYGCIATDGYVTSTNFSCICSSVGAITSAPSDVITAIVGFLTSLGATGTAQVSQVAGLETGANCTACGAWCYHWSFAGSAAEWAATAGNPGNGSWESGPPVGAIYGAWNPDEGYTVIDITYPHDIGVTFTTLRIQGLVGAGVDDASLRTVVMGPSGSLFPFTITTGSFDITVPIAGFFQDIRVVIYSSGNFGQYITDVTACGTDVRPDFTGGAFL